MIEIYSANVLTCVEEGTMSDDTKGKPDLASPVRSKRGLMPHAPKSWIRRLCYWLRSFSMGTTDRRNPRNDPRSIRQTVLSNLWLCQLMKPHTPDANKHLHKIKTDFVTYTHLHSLFVALVILQDTLVVSVALSQLPQQKSWLEKTL